MSNELSNVTEIRPYSEAEDLAAVRRIWREIGWTDDENDDKQVQIFFSVGTTLVATINGAAECSVHCTEGTMRLQETDLDLCAVTAVTTSRIARGHAFAQRLTAAQLQSAAQNGAVVAALGMFDQGFYDKLGFGTGGYDHQFVIDPNTLLVERKVPTPKRLGVEDFDAMYTAMAMRAKVNGSVVIQSSQMFRAEVGFDETAFGLGYETAGQLSHFVWMLPKGERGPYRILHMAYQDSDQLMELLALLKSLSDQVYSLRMMEPPHVQLQALIQRPFRHESVSQKSPHEASHESFAWWQFRVLSVEDCVAALVCPGEITQFQLEVRDPVEAILEAGEWRGVGGNYLVTLGATSHAVRGEDAQLPKLSCSVNALSRLLWCVASASSLAITDDFDAPHELLAQLDRVLRLPSPRPGWDF